MKTSVTLYYDKACPFCSRYADFVRLQRDYTLHIRDARVTLEEISRRCPECDINQGMIVVVENRCLQGIEALRWIDSALGNRGLIRNLHHFWKLDRIFTAPVYRIIKHFRSIVLILRREEKNIFSLYPIYYISQHIQC